MEFTLTIYSKEYKCYVVEQSGRAKGTRFKAYGNFDDKFIEAQSSSSELAIKKLNEKAIMILDY